MTPTLERFIRLARSRITGTPLSPEEIADTHKQEEIEQFKIYLVRKVRLDVRWELFAERIWDRNEEGCLLEFAVDGRVFLLQQIGKECKLTHQVRGQHVMLELLADDQQFEDRLLVAVGDALQAPEL